MNPFTPNRANARSRGRESINSRGNERRSSIHSREHRANLLKNNDLSHFNNLQIGSNKQNKDKIEKLQTKLVNECYSFDEKIQTIFQSHKEVGSGEGIGPTLTS